MCRVAVGLGGAYPVAGAVGVQAVEVGDLAVDVPAYAFLVGLVGALKDDARGIEVVDLAEGDVLGLHLLPYRVAVFDPGLELILEAHLVETLANGRGKAGKHLLVVGRRFLDLLVDGLVGLGVLILEAQVLELGLDGKQAQAVGQRGVDVECLAGYLVLLVGRHRGQGAHVVQAVGHLDEYHAYVGAHREQQLPEVLGLRRGMGAEDAARYLGEPLHNLGYLLAKLGLDVLDGVVGVLYHVVKQRGAYRGGPQPNLLAHNRGHGYGVHDVGLSRAATYALVGLFRKPECLLNDFHFLAMIA